MNQLNFEITLSELDIDENSEIGKGTFGEVRKGIWRGEEVAIKFLKSSMLSSQESIKSFIDECNIMKNLHHPNILLFMGACTKGPEFFVVTEYCENGNLFELLHINQSQKFTYEDVRRIALEIAFGVNYLHSFKPPILHRDLKSMNVLLDRNLQVKLADFGNTKYLDIQMTKQKGTFQWMAPEVIKGNVYTEKSDVFSFGIIMNELVMRIPPYQGKDKKEVARKVVRNPDYRPNIGKKVPKEWIDLMVKCYAHDEKKRPGFNEIIDCLKKMKLPKEFIYVPK
jgi:mitogen-activated protein kinase kinase kinase 9